MFEYKVIPAPRKGVKAKGVKTPEDRFSFGLEELMNTEARSGWEFVRAETLPSEERSGFRSAQVVYRTVLIFRKAADVAAEPMPVQAPAPVIAPEPQPRTEPAADPAPQPQPADEPLLEAADYAEDDQDSSKANA